MKILKYVLLLLLVLIVAGAIFVATRPNEYDVVRSKVIKAPVDVVFNNINDYKNWEAWGPWKEEDSTIVATYPEQTSGVGASYSWTSKNGPGKIKTLSLTQNQSIEQEMQFGDYEPSQVYWKFEEVDEGTKLSWGMKSDNTPLIFKFFGVLNGGMDKMLGDMEEKGLHNIEREVMAEMKKNPPQKFRIGDISEEDATAKQFIGYFQQTSTDTAIEEMTKLFMEYMPKAGQYAAMHSLEQYTPGSYYVKWDEQTKEAEFYIGLMVHNQEALTPADGMKVVQVPAGKIIKVSKFGPYGVGDMEAHAKIATYLEENKLVPAGPVWELYENDPTNVKPEDIQTDIYYSVTNAN
ncbi:SRPBCC family protein [Kordia zhangzhouensis]|uniref:SRPBCC family protein n=1 Tax=Kordia zhangzhouensis TaxID=1620405 RepID=UPI000699ED4F|nr:SRPBCC family protein [Kordia zhangzhouensis]